MIEENPIIVIILVVLLLIYGLVVSHWNMREQAELQERINRRKRHQQILEERKKKDEEISRANSYAYTMVATFNR